MIPHTAGGTERFFTGRCDTSAPEGANECLRPAEDEAHQRHHSHHVPGVVSLLLTLDHPGLKLLLRWNLFILFPGSL